MVQVAVAVGVAMNRWEILDPDIKLYRICPDIFTEAEIQQWDRDSWNLGFISERRCTKLCQWEAYRRAQRLRWDTEKVAKKVVFKIVLKVVARGRPLVWGGRPLGNFWLNEL